MKRLVLRTTLFGLSLSSLFFYPLISTFHSEPWLLQWNRINAIELFLAFLFFSFLFSSIFFIFSRTKNIKIQTFIFVSLSLIPALSFFIHLARQMGIGWLLVFINDFLEKNNLTFILIFFIILFIFSKYSWILKKCIIVSILILSPLSILTLITITQSYFITSITQIDKPISNVEENKEFPSPRYLFLLFDELSYEYLYKDGKVREEFPYFSLLASVSTQYHNASAPGKATLQSIPQYLLGTREHHLLFEKPHFNEIFDSNEWNSLKSQQNLFSEARNSKMEPMAFGPYFAYCEMFYEELKKCQSYSIYNFATISPSFSLMNPIITTIILWPRQLPLGFLKRKLYPIWQAEGISQILKNTHEALRVKKPHFIFSHFYIPHLPFTFNREGFAPAKNPFLQDDANYIHQLEYTDTLLGMILQELQKLGTFDTTTIVVFSDHNYRIMFSDEEKSHVPIIIKHAYQQNPTNIIDPVNTEEILIKFIRESSESPLGPNTL